MMSQQCTCRPLTACVGLFALLVSGCGGGKGDVSGLVTFKGEPLPNGRVTFICQTGTKEVFSSAVVNGRYTIAGIPVGPVTITVETFPPPPATAPPTNIPGGVPPHIKGLPGPGESLPAPEKYVAVPPRYSNMQQSRLSYTVTAGRQEHEITLVP